MESKSISFGEEEVACIQDMHKPTYKSVGVPKKYNIPGIQVEDEAGYWTEVTPLIHIVDDAVRDDGTYNKCGRFLAPIEDSDSYGLISPGTPRHPSYPSGHSTYSAAASAILRYFFLTKR